MIPAPAPAEIAALRVQLQLDLRLTVPAAQAHCARLIWVESDAWQAWERGESVPHPAFWELATIKIPREIESRLSHRAERLDPHDRALRETLLPLNDRLQLAFCTRNRDRFVHLVGDVSEEEADAALREASRRYAELEQGRAPTRFEFVAKLRTAQQLRTSKDLEFQEHAEASWTFFAGDRDIYRLMRDGPRRAKQRAASAARLLEITSKRPNADPKTSPPGPNRPPS